MKDLPKDLKNFFQDALLRIRLWFSPEKINAKGEYVNVIIERCTSATLIGRIV